MLSLATDRLGRLTCVMSDGGTEAAVSAFDGKAASSDLMEALDAADSGGCGECFWSNAEGEYRWIFRREGARVRIAVLWCSGALTGWEHVFWSEDDYETLVQRVRQALSAAHSA